MNTLEKDFDLKLKNSINLDEIFISTGKISCYHKCIIFVVSLVAISTAFNNLGYVFWAARLDHICIESDFRANYSSWNSLNISQNNPCEIKNSKVSLDDVNKSFEKCSKWIYRTDVIKSSIVSEMNLVCDKSWLVSISQSGYMAGRFFGGLLYGHVSDRFGRKPSLILAIGLQLFFSITSSFVNDIHAFIIVRFLLGIQTTGEFQIAFVYATENVAPSYRTHTGILLHIVWAFAYMFLGGLAYFLRERFSLQLAISLGLIPLIFLCCLIPESPRFLLSVNKVEECIKVLEKMIPKKKKIFFSKLKPFIKSDEKVKKSSIIDLKNYPNMRRTTLILSAAWFACSFVYYGISLNSSSYSKNIYINFILCGLIEIPSYLIVIPIFKNLGRPVPISLFVFMAGLFIILNFFTSTFPLLTVFLTVLGKGFITSGYGMIYIFSAELYPTKMRNSGLGICSIFARAGAAIAPFTTDLNTSWRYMPLLIYSSISFLTALIIFFLPETKNKLLPQTLEEGEHFNSFYRCPCRRK